MGCKIDVDGRPADGQFIGIAKVVRHVTDERGACFATIAILYLGQNLYQRLFQYSGQQGKPAAMHAAHVHSVYARAGGVHQQLAHQHDRGFGALGTKPLFRREFYVQKILEFIDP